MTFGEFVKEHRKRLDLKLIEAAEELEISSGYLCDIEKGNRPAPIEKLGRFISLYNIQDLNKFYDLAAKTQKEKKNKIPKDIYDFIKNNENSWPLIRDLVGILKS